MHGTLQYPEAALGKLKVGRLPTVSQPRIDSKILQRGEGEEERDRRVGGRQASLTISLHKFCWFPESFKGRRDSFYVLSLRTGLC